mmetsp:Transcript_27367/g.38492  ORF Transcript_27367/g.38492 Transcript_27367/m.38492 type:complete len:302 (+) Transcript_27367:136-1041(+)
MRLTLALLGVVALCESFTVPNDGSKSTTTVSVSLSSQWGRRQHRSTNLSSKLQMTATNATATTTEMEQDTTTKASSSRQLVSTHFPKADVVEFTLEHHVPLGCSVEESLAVNQETGNYADDQHVFVSKVTEGGNADAAGIQVGDVIVGVTGTFGVVSDVSGLGLDHIRSLISAVLPHNPLQLVVARGTGVMEAHESAIVDLCIMPETNANEIDSCVKAIHNMAYVDDEEVVVDCSSDGEEECMLDDVFAMWAEDLPEQPQAKEEEPKEEESAPKPAPWSSRSSPSGTYVRNPKTGKMENIG